MTNTDAADGAFHTFHEITGQPEAWRATLTEVAAAAEGVRAYLPASDAVEVLFTGCGSPYFLARTAAALCQAVAGVPAQAHPASDLLLYPQMVLGPARPRLLVAISRSGETTEVVRAIELFAARRGGPAVAITCYADSPVGRAVDLALETPAGRERGLAQTRSFTSMLLTAQALICALAGRPPSAAFRALPDAGAALLRRYDGLARQLGADDSIQRVFFLGGGPRYGLACEAMLKMKEMSLSPSEAYQFLEFRHGPMSMVDDRTLVVGLLGEAALAQEAAVLAEMRALGARVLAITPAPLPDAQADHQVLLPAGPDDAERGALYLPVLHLLAFFRARHKRLDPDALTNVLPVVRLALDPIAQGKSHAP